MPKSKSKSKSKSKPTTTTTTTQEAIVPKTETETETTTTMLPAQDLRPILGATPPAFWPADPAEGCRSLVTVTLNRPVKGGLTVKVDGKDKDRPYMRWQTSAAPWGKAISNGAEPMRVLVALEPGSTVKPVEGLNAVYVDGPCYLFRTVVDRQTLEARAKADLAPMARESAEQVAARETVEREERAVQTLTDLALGGMDLEALKALVASAAKAAGLAGDLGDDDGDAV